MSSVVALLLCTAVAAIAPGWSTESCPHGGEVAEGLRECAEAEVEDAEEREAALLRMELLQKALRPAQVRRKGGAEGAAGDEKQLEARTGQIEFSLARKDFANATVLIPQMLQAAGLQMCEFVPRFLRVYSAAGNELRMEPQAADFPLHFKYALQPGGPLRRTSSARLRQAQQGSELSSAGGEASGGSRLAGGAVSAGDEASAGDESFAGDEVFAGDGNSEGKWLGRRRRTAAEPERTTYTASQEELDFEVLSSNVYDFSRSDPECWERVLQASLVDGPWRGRDNVAVYTCRCKGCMTGPDEQTSNISQESSASGRRACALAISGSNDLMDWSENVDIIWNSHFCGRTDYHSGFADEASSIVNSPSFAAFGAKLRACDRLSIVGHSLGGAVATLLADCVNCHPSASCQKPAALQGIAAEAELYTFGAPAVRAESAPTNDRSPTGSFRGRRFWNYDMRSCIHRFCASWCCWSLGNQDPVPYVAQKIGYRHPKMESVGLDEHGEVEVWTSSSPFAVLEPNSFQWPKISEHMTSQYFARVQMHLKKG